MAKIIFLVVVSFIFCISRVESQWVQTTLNNFHTSGLYSNNNYFFVGSYDSGLYVTSNNGINWFRTGSPLYNVTCMHKFKNKFYAGTNASGLIVSTNDGINWSVVYAGLTNIASLASDSNALYMSCSSSDYLIKGIYKSTNEGYNWVRIIATSPVGAITSSNNNLIATFLANSPIWPDPNGMYYSTNAGNNWILSNSSATAWCYKTKNSLLYAGIGVGHYLSYGIRMSTNFGIHWDILTTFNNKSVTSIEYYNNYLFASTSDQGVYLSSDNFYTWIMINQGLSDTATNSMIIKDSIIFLSTRDHGVWKRPIYEVTSIIPNHQKMPNAFSLHQNYPNPFNSKTLIRYSLNKYSDIKMIIFDLLGQEILTIHPGKKYSGTYDVSFDASNLPSGVYFYRLTVDGFSETRKMVLIK